MLEVRGTDGGPSKKGKGGGKAKGDDESYSPPARAISMTEKDKPDMLDLVRVDALYGGSSTSCFHSCTAVSFLFSKRPTPLSLKCRLLRIEVLQSEWLS